MKKLWKAVSALCVVYTVYDIYTTSHKKYKHAKKLTQPIHLNLDVEPDDTCQGTKEPELHGETTVKVENGKPTDDTRVLISALEVHGNWDETCKRIKAELEKQKELLDERKDRIDDLIEEILRKEDPNYEPDSEE